MPKLQRTTSVVVDPSLAWQGRAHFVIPANQQLTDEQGQARITVPFTKDETLVIIGDALRSLDLSVENTVSGMLTIRRDAQRPRFIDSMSFTVRPGTTARLQLLHTKGHPAPGALWQKPFVGGRVSIVASERVELQAAA